MKKSLLTLFALILLAGTSCQVKIDIEKEKKAIIAVIEEETDAFVHQDYERWANTYVHNETNFRLSSNTDQYNFVSGWEELNASYKDWFENDSVNVPTWEGVKTNYIIKVYGNSAWALCDEKAINPESGEDMGWTGKEVRFLEKIEDAWKITFLSFVVTSSYEEEAEKGEEESEKEDSE